MYTKLCGEASLAAVLLLQVILLHAPLVCEVEGEVVPLVEEGGEDSGEDLEVVVAASEDVGDVGEEGEEEGLTDLGLCLLVLCLCSGGYH